MTKQRAMLLEIFRSEECVGRHRTAEEILGLAKKKNQAISRATVYNNLRSMENEGLIRRVSGDGGAYFYDSTSMLHGHLICACCGQIKDILAEDMLSALESLSGEKLISYELKMRYICRACGENR